MNSNNLKKFIKELELLTQKYDVVIRGEGCDKPYIDSLSSGEELACDLEYDTDTKQYNYFVRF